MHATNNAARSHLENTPEKCLQEADRSKKNIYLEAFLHQHRNVLPFVTSADGLLGVESETTLKRIYSRLSTKWQQPHSRTCGYVKSRVAITFVCATHQYIRGSRVLAHSISVQFPQREDGSRINLFR